MASARPIEQSGWMARVQRNSQGGTLPTVSNAMLVLANDPELAGLLAYDAFRSEHLLMRAPPAPDDSPSLPGPYPRPWGLEDVVFVLGYLQRIWSPKFGRETTEHAMLAEASMRRFHPVADWLTGLAWDGTPRIDKWLSAAFDAENNRYHRAIGAKFLIAAVRRVRQPGCKFDHMLVLEGSQGIGKSRACRALFGDAWFSDAIPPDLTSKDAAMALLGVWCLEFAEIEHLIRAEVETIKAFLSRPVDRYRPPYGKAYVERPRQGVLIGTTNADDYLRDATGNRRIWPVRCRRADPDWIALNREQLWAEAAFRERRGETTWLDDDDVREEAGHAQAERMAEDLWETAIAEWLRGRVEVRLADVLAGAIGMTKEKLDKRAEMRVGAILRGLGWKKGQARREGRGPGKLWFCPGRAPPDPETQGQEELL
jgi:putative DNA primase/helicase